ncbi:hypothetical protein [Croceicoccus gelatinilyticus]|uniref:hypothetical protein n=1 Tax=Croceicoccus gelatinilyticus TaxID=2835536 RepID=UPI001BCBCE06|nr:hypothetical protein [Croceicoccus gelatinilyticus]MBS7668313.1 hypothetical protein [Croceicoccus gelatinilyticus]
MSYNSDPDKILSLLLEYTSKLRSVCDDQMEREIRQRNSLWFSVFSFIIALFMIAFIYNQQVVQGLRIDQMYFFAFSLLAISAIILQIALLVFRVSRKSNHWDALNIESILLRLIKLASGEFEYRNNTLSDRLEFEIRLSEAESALRMSRDVFHARGRDDREDLHELRGPYSEISNASVLREN